MELRKGEQYGRIVVMDFKCKLKHTNPETFSLLRTIRPDKVEVQCSPHLVVWPRRSTSGSLCLQDRASRFMLPTFQNFALTKRQGSKGRMLSTMAHTWARFRLNQRHSEFRDMSCSTGTLILTYEGTYGNFLRNLGVEDNFSHATTAPLHHWISKRLT